MSICKPANLATIDITVAGHWGQMAPQHDALPILKRMRTAALAKVRLLSDGQPPSLVVEGDPHNPDLPLVDVRPRGDGAAWIWLRVDGPFYAQLCYQFGHELGHVLCNRWGGGQANMPAPPSQWIEEVLVEAFGLYGLRALVPLWQEMPPQPYMERYHEHLMDYVEEVLRQCRSLRQQRGLPENFSSWYTTLAKELEEATKLPGAPQIFVPQVYDTFVNEPDLREDLGALNRWPERSSVPIKQYVELWKQSCRQIGTVGRLPNILVESFRLS